MPEDTLAGHLAFALRYEGVELAVQHALFTRIGGSEIETWVRREPVGRYARRAWFFYEWLMGKKLKLPDASTGNFVDALDVRQYYAGPSLPSRRRRWQRRPRSRHGFLTVNNQVYSRKAAGFSAKTDRIAISSYEKAEGPAGTNSSSALLGLTQQPRFIGSLAAHAAVHRKQLLQRFT